MPCTVVTGWRQGPELWKHGFWWSPGPVKTPAMPVSASLLAKSFKLNAGWETYTVKKQNQTFLWAMIMTTVFFFFSLCFSLKGSPPTHTHTQNPNYKFTDHFDGLGQNLMDKIILLSVQVSSVPSPSGSSGGHEESISREPLLIFSAGSPCEHSSTGRQF